MKKIMLSCLLIVSLFCLCSCYEAPDLGDVEIVKVTCTDTSYRKSTEWEHAQGLAYDGTYFYFAGHNDDTDEPADIHVIDAATYQDVRVLRRAGALHSAELYYNYTTKTLFACSGGDGRRPYVFEIDTDTGERLNAWYFDDYGEKGGGLLTFNDTGDLILFTSSGDGAKIAFDIVSLGKDGAFSVKESYKYSDTDLGVPQGLEFYDGYVYLLDDAGRTVEKNPHYIYKMSLKDNKITIVTAYSISFKKETEGLCFAPDGTVYMGSAQERIYRFDKKIFEW